jgi:dihydrofolate reductase
MKKNNLQHKPRYIGFIASSIDGRISLSKHHPPNWTSKEDWQFFQKSLSTFDAVIVGRNTYLSVAERLRKRNTFVFSSRPKTIKRRGSVTFLNPAHVDLALLFQGYKKVAVLGGGAVYRHMLECELLDELFLTIEPLIFGRGKEMFIGGTKIIRANVISIKKLNSQGTLLIHYQIHHK